MLQILISIVTTLLVLTLLIVVHEFGHYIAAKRQGIKVTGFSIGFGPRLFKWMRDETEFAIRPIFIGGYVKFADDIEKDPMPGDLRAAPLKARVLTIFAGPLMNVIFAFLLVVVLLLSFGGYGLYVGEVMPNSPAAKAGILPGDRLLRLDGVELELDMDFAGLQQVQKGDYSDIQIERDGEIYNMSVPYMYNDGNKLIGVQFNPQTDIRPTKLNFFDALRLSFKWIGLQMQGIIQALGDLFSGHTQNISGIVGTTQVIGEVATNPVYGIDTMITVIALLSVNLAIVNLFPLPALDGGKLVMYAVEGIRKKPTPEKLEGILNLAGFAFLIGLSIFLVFHDISRLAV